MKYLLLASMLLFQTQPVTEPAWVCTFTLRADKPLMDPVVHIHVLVNGKSEGDAAIRANTYVQGFMRDDGKLLFLEAQLKK
jgi:hypothetical protein